MPNRSRMAGLLSLVVPGAGQCARGRWTDGLWLLFAVSALYLFGALLLNQHMGFLWGPDGVPPNWRPSQTPPHDWALLLLGVGMHVLAVWDASRKERPRD